jgi:hypothetical protein
MRLVAVNFKKYANEEDCKKALGDEYAWVDNVRKVAPFPINHPG